MKYENWFRSIRAKAVSFQYQSDQAEKVVRVLAKLRVKRAEMNGARRDYVA